jgi:hypothetical protein
MQMKTAARLFPKAITPRGVIHFVYDFEPRDGVVVFPLCKEQKGECIKASFKVPRHKGWYCIKCLEAIEDLEDDY